MRVYIGGAYNGKVAVVEKALQRLDEQQALWLDAKLPEQGTNLVVVNNLHLWLKSFEGTEEQAIEKVKQSIENRPSFVILTDIGRGIVPMERAERVYRDLVGRVYQALIQDADEVFQVWYGLTKQIK